MTKLKEKRYKIINEMIESYGLYVNGKVIISIWDLAHNINNTRKISPFITDEGKINKKRINDRGYAIEWFQLHNIFNQLKHGTRGTDIKFVESKKGTNYFVKQI